MNPADPKIEWLRTALGVKIGSPVGGTSTPGAQAGGQPLASLLQSYPDAIGQGAVYTDVSAPDPKVIKQLQDEWNALQPDIAKAGNVLPVTPELKKFLAKVDAATKAFVAKVKANDATGALAAIVPLKAAVKDLLDAAAAQDKATLPKATAAETTVTDLVKTNKLAGKTNAEKIELLRQLQGPATKKKEFRQAQGAIYKTMDLDDKFKKEDEKKRAQVVKTLVATPKEKADLKDKRDKWSAVGKDGKPLVSEADKIALLKKALEAQCKVLGIPVPEIVPEHIGELSIPQPDGTIAVGHLNGAFNPDDGKIHVNFGDPQAKVNDFEQALDLIFHENSHHYQEELVKKLKDKKLKKTDPEYEQALLFEVDSGAGYLGPADGKDNYEQQPLEKHSRLNGPDTAKLVNKELN